MGENSNAQKLRFMGLMQSCFPFEWQKYWDCEARDFDVLTILQDIENPQLSLKERVLLSLLARIWTGGKDSLPEGYRADGLLDEEKCRILIKWLQDQSPPGGSGVLAPEPPPRCETCKT
jgi:hypothetical protein